MQRKTNPNPKAVIYARYSPRPKKKDGKGEAVEPDTIEAQTAWCREYCKQRGFEVVGEFFDANASGADLERQGLWDAIESLKPGMLLVAHRLDRVARGDLPPILIEQAVQKKRAHIVSASGEGTWEESEDSWFVKRIIYLFGEQQRRLTIARTRAAMRRKQRAGLKMSSIPPYGWQVDNQDQTRLVEVAEEQGILNFMSAQALMGRSAGQIARSLGEQGLTCRGGVWHRRTVARILNRLPAES